MLTPVAEYDSEVSSVGSVGIRRHSAFDVTSCIEPQGYSALSVGIETSSTSRLSLDHDLSLSGVMRGATGQPALISPPVFIHSTAGCLHVADAPMALSEVDKALSSPPSLFLQSGDYCNAGAGLTGIGPGRNLHRLFPLPLRFFRTSRKTS